MVVNLFYLGDGREARSARDPRATQTIKLKCGLVLVADYRYFESMGQSNKQKTTHSMVKLSIIPFLNGNNSH